MLPLYAKIESLCSANGITITEMCRRAAIPRSALSDYKTGRKKTISITNLEKISACFGVSLDELMGHRGKNFDYVLDKPDTGLPPLNQAAPNYSLSGGEKKPFTSASGDERDICSALEAALESLERPLGNLLFCGRPLTQTARELLITNLRGSIAIGKALTK